MLGANKRPQTLPFRNRNKELIPKIGTSARRKILLVPSPINAEALFGSSAVYGNVTNENDCAARASLIL
jgi:hypothetical protein